MQSNIEQSLMKKKSNLSPFDTIRLNIMSAYNTYVSRSELENEPIPFLMELNNFIMRSMKSGRNY